MPPALTPVPLPDDGFAWTFAAPTGLALDATIHPDSPVLERFYAGYDQAFILPREREELEGFKVCLRLGGGADYQFLSGAYGPYREVVLVARDGAEVIGGANFIAFPLPGEMGAAGAPLISSNLNYIFVAAGARGRGYFRRLYGAVRALIGSLFVGPGDGPTPQLLTFIEQNDPLRMPAEDYARDTAFTGLDQLERIRIWAKLDAKVVDHPYVQPALSADQDPDDTLVLSVLGAAGASLPASALAAHLTRFFGISVLKGAELSADPDAARQLGQLAGLGAGPVALLDPLPLAVARTPEEARTRVGGAGPDLTFLQALKRVG